MTGMNQDELLELQENELEALKGKDASFFCAYLGHNTKRNRGAKACFLSPYYHSYLHGGLSAHYRSVGLEGTLNDQGSKGSVFMALDFSKSHDHFLLFDRWYPRRPSFGCTCFRRKKNLSDTFR